MNTLLCQPCDLGCIIQPPEPQFPERMIALLLPRVHTKMMKFLTRGFKTVHGTSRTSILKIKTDKQILFFLLPTYLIHFF